MDGHHTSYELLAHFDRPTEQESARERRGVAWVLQWAAALAVMFVATCVLVEFGYCLGAELSLTRAARAGVLEATLPRASHQTVAATIQRRLAAYPSAAGRLRLSVHHNGSVVAGPLHPRDGDHFAVTLAAPTDAVIPRWLRAVRFWPTAEQVEVRAERRMPSRSISSRH